MAKNALVLLYPCLTFLFIKCIITKETVDVAFLDFYKNPETNLWFLWVLFCIHVAFDLGLYLSNRIKNRLSFFVPVFISMLLSLIIFLLVILLKEKFDSKILSIKLIAYYIPFYCFGYLFHCFLNTGILKNKKIKIASYLILLILFIFLIFECFYFKSIYSFDDFNFKNLILRISGSVSSILICCYLADLIVRFKVVLKISKYGAFSLQSYYLHIILLEMITISHEELLIQWLISICVCILLILGVAVFIVAFYYIPFLHLIVFGRSYSCYKFEKRLPKILR